MPIYEYRCDACKRRIEIFFRSFSQIDSPACSHCGSASLTRLVSKVSVVKSWGSAMSSPDDFGDVDENDPHAMERWMMDMKRGMGDPDPHMSDFDMMDAGIDPSDRHGHHGHDHDDFGDF
jgi:putative FmdB family regulatory protein